MARRGYTEERGPEELEPAYVEAEELGVEEVSHGAGASEEVAADLEGVEAVAALEEPVPEVAALSAYDEAILSAHPVLREANAARTKVRMAGHHLHLGDHPYARMILFGMLEGLHQKVDALVARLEAAGLIEPAKTREKA